MEKTKISVLMDPILFYSRAYSLGTVLVAAGTRAITLAVAVTTANI